MTNPLIEKVLDESICIDLDSSQLPTSIFIWIYTYIYCWRIRKIFMFCIISVISKRKPQRPTEKRGENRSLCRKKHLSCHPQVHMGRPFYNRCHGNARLLTLDSLWTHLSCYCPCIWLDPAGDLPQGTYCPLSTTLMVALLRAAHRVGIQ